MHRWVNIIKSISRMHHTDRMKHENHVIVSKKYRNDTCQNSTFLMIKKDSQKLGVKGVFLNSVKNMKKHHQHHTQS
jgi:hypothetical protein